MAKIEKTDNGNCWGGKGKLCSLLVRVQTVSATVEITVEIPQKAMNRSAAWSSHTTFVVYPNSISYYRNTCWSMFIATLFVIARNWKWSKCPSSDEWIMKMWYMYTMEYYSAVKIKEIMQFTCKCMEMEAKSFSVLERQSLHVFSHL